MYSMTQYTVFFYQGVLYFLRITRLPLQVSRGNGSLRSKNVASNLGDAAALAVDNKYGSI